MRKAQLAWSRLARGQLTVQRLKVFFAQLGKYLEAVKNRAKGMTDESGAPESFLVLSPRSSRDSGNPEAQLAWDRLARGQLTVSRLKGFFGQLGHYLKAVKQRAQAVKER